ncbi:hypothetical protein P691DRAFT_766485 [Macrolepiota fuliginosa MF-IS2]|uniref:Uncharacterized protein n=1 Tax=Macrolepiota fuliginosa MF-IS2 TaxID=1400762 RepID=A0A9P5WYC1_9AGAR|nr:hypothetical protein P691DRAFT_766485 [Macrolepiota fuliginosa MF-IS2]
MPSTRTNNELQARDVLGGRRRRDDEHMSWPLVLQPCSPPVVLPALPISYFVRQTPPPSPLSSTTQPPILNLLSTVGNAHWLAIVVPPPTSPRPPVNPQPYIFGLELILGYRRRPSTCGYTCSVKENTKAGAHFVSGTFTTSVRTEVDAGLALPDKYTENKPIPLESAAFMGLGLGRCGSYHEDIISYILPRVSNDTAAAEISSSVTLLPGFIFMDSKHVNVSTTGREAGAIPGAFCMGAGEFGAGANIHQVSTPIGPFGFGTQWKALTQRNPTHPLMPELDVFLPRRISRPGHMVLDGSKAIL